MPHGEPRVGEAVLKVLRHEAGAVLPVKAHADDAGYDLTALSVAALRPRVFAFDTGLSLQFPAGCYGEVLPRSSIVKTDFMLANSVGVIDPGYRGRLRVVLRYLGTGEGGTEAEALVGTRIAQLIVRRLEAVQVVAVTVLEGSARGEGGFGSTGR
ncbi:MAG: dUTP diphosphatase [Candidatus Lambdaproteobacteria bacterium]|nr:dUTP diphosphatase [Candidatus Lambdaproteobacteria bacterium]